MTTKIQITEALISSRNILLNGRTNEHVLSSLEAVIAGVDSITVQSTKNILRRCVAEAIAKIKTSDLFSAGMILNLIHNLPLDDEAKKRWDVDYFLSFELSTFLDKYEEIKSSRMIVLYVCAELARDDRWHRH